MSQREAVKFDVDPDVWGGGGLFIQRVYVRNKTTVGFGDLDNHDNSLHFAFPLRYSDIPP